jgi:hypothetical protein
MNDFKKGGRRIQIQKIEVGDPTTQPTNQLTNATINQLIHSIIHSIREPQLQMSHTPVPLPTC